MEILDTAGVAQFTAMRELYIKNGQGFILVYSVTDKNSLQELLSIREQIIRIKGSNNIPMVLVGNKCDLTEERELEPEDGINVSKQWNKVPFYETSAMYRMNVDDSFVDVVRQIIRKEVQQQQANEQQTVSQSSPHQGDQQLRQPQVLQKSANISSTNSSTPNRLNQPTKPAYNSAQKPQTSQSVQQTKISSAPPKKTKKSKKCVIL